MVKRRVFERDGWKCLRCGFAVTESERALQVSRERKTARQFLTLDHVRPQSRGGAFEIGNLQTLCNHCNQRKGTALEEELFGDDSEAA
jgi:5-methylcytosine-specific restriction endonuclease McrA